MLKQYVISGGQLDCKHDLREFATPSETIESNLSALLVLKRRVVIRGNLFGLHSLWNADMCFLYIEILWDRLIIF